MIKGIDLNFKLPIKSTLEVGQEEPDFNRPTSISVGELIEIVKVSAVEEAYKSYLQTYIERISTQKLVYELVERGYTVTKLKEQNHAE